MVRRAAVTSRVPDCGLSANSNIENANGCGTSADPKLDDADHLWILIFRIDLIKLFASISVSSLCFLHERFIFYQITSSFSLAGGNLN